MRTARWAVLLAATACGYQVGFGAHERLGIRTVAIHTVANDTFRQGLDVALTRRLGSDLTQFTGLVPGPPGAADARLEVTLREVTGRSISEIGGGVVLEGAVLLAAEVRLVENATGRTIHHSKHRDWAEFRSRVGETLSSALDEATADLSRKICSSIDRGLARTP